MKKNLYELLEVSPHATTAQIKAAMIRLGKKYAVKAQTDKRAQALYNQIKIAYQTLSNPYIRAGYDEYLREQTQRQEERNLKSEALEQQLRDYIKEWKISPKQAKEYISQAFTLEPIYRFKDKIGQPTLEAYVQDQLLPGEAVVHKADIHWLSYLDLGAVILMVMSLYLFVQDPFNVLENSPMVTIWLPFLYDTRDFPEISVWHTGLGLLFFIGSLISLEMIIVRHTTELVITSRRVILKVGFLGRTVTEIKLPKFESIMLEQSIFGRLFNYGHLTIIGIGGVRAEVPCVVAPLQFKQTIWRLLDRAQPAPVVVESIPELSESENEPVVVPLRQPHSDSRYGVAD